MELECGVGVRWIRECAYVDCGIYGRVKRDPVKGCAGLFVRR